ncbi:hypothetical protein LJC36_00285 [Desulfovibrio sp. OttesenSCG-928-C14]|nr:hypothetical protein [Desulfovibrio sp. OttesenSCG-928-C14]
MRIFAVDGNNDLYIGPEGRLAIKTGLAAFMQMAEHAMQTLLAEPVFAEDRGLPYFETAWIGNPNLRQFEEAARGTLGTLEGTREVTEFECSIADNVLRYRAVISSVYGEAVIEGANANG